MGEPSLKESTQHIFIGLVQNMRQDVEAAAMRHPNHDLLHLKGRLQHDLVNQHHQGIQTFEAVPTLSGECVMQISLETFSLAQQFQHVAALIIRHQRDG